MNGRFRFPAQGVEVDPAFVAMLANLERESIQLDSRYRVAGTQIRFGLDPIIGIVPFVGDIAGAMWSLRLVDMARKLGAEPPLVRKMLWNVAIDFIVGLVPFIGPIADTFYRCNMRNLALLLEAVELNRSSVAVAEN